MDDVQRKLDVLLDYWVEHNTEHAEEFREWAARISSLSGVAAQELLEAAARMSDVNEQLMKAKQALPKSEE